MLAEDRSLRARAQEAAVHVERGVAEVNELGLEAQRAELAAIAPELLEKIRPDTGPKELPPLPDAVDGKVVLRLAPYPSGPLHIGNARAFVLNDAYTKRYHGRLLLVFDDTIGSEDKPLLPEAFDQVKEGLDWAGVEYDEVLYKSDRIPLHYEWAEKLLATSEAYVCEARIASRTSTRRSRCGRRCSPGSTAKARPSCGSRRTWPIRIRRSGTGSCSASRCGNTRASARSTGCGRCSSSPGPSTTPCWA